MESFRKINKTLETVGDFIRWGTSRFNAAALHFGHGTDNAADEAAWLVLHALHLPHETPAYFYQSRLTSAEKKAVYTLLRRRIEERKPAAYLIGEAWFAGLRFTVNENVLVPRSAIAELIQQRFEPWMESGAVRRILDLCTGSGCIAVACAQAFPEAEVDAADVSPAALDVARDNLGRYGLQGSVRLLESDLFDALQAERYDIIVSNPPYVGAEEIAALPTEFSHEPRLGLAGGGGDGLDLVARILREAGAHLTPQGVLVVEVGNSWPALERRYPDVPFTWLEFEHGDGGVFLLTAAQLREHRNLFEAA